MAICWSPIPTVLSCNPESALLFAGGSDLNTRDFPLGNGCSERDGELVAGSVLLPFKECTLMTECHWVVSHVFSTALDGSVHWPWSVARMTRVRHWETKTLRLTFRPKMRAREGWVDCRKTSSRAIRAQRRNLDLSTMAERSINDYKKLVS